MFLPPSLSDDCRLKRAASSAGTRPKKIPVNSDTPNVKPRTGRLTVTSRNVDSDAGAIAINAFVPHHASARPRTPPSADSITLSVSNCLTILQRLAPSPVRTAISFRREVARASKRFATLAQAINKTRPTAPNENEQRRANVAGELKAQRNNSAHPSQCRSLDTADEGAH